jgi:hypothetical protein
MKLEDNFCLKKPKKTHPGFEKVLMRNREVAIYKM